MAETIGEIESERDAMAEGRSFVDLWLSKIERAKEDLKPWHEKADEAVVAYEAGDPKDNTSVKPSFNIFHSSVETKVPALYNSTPIPDVRRRYGDADPVGKLAIDVIERGLSHALDQYDFDTAMTEAVKDEDITSLGQVRVRYSADFLSDGVTKAYERVTCEHVTWSKWGYGMARRWEDVPFVWFEHDLSKDDIARLGVEPERVKRMGFSTAEKDDDDDDAVRGILKTICVYEVWDLATRSVFFLTEQDKEQPLKVTDDPLGLDGFFPVPRPLMALRKRGRLEPRTAYHIHKDLFDEIDKITKRINRLVAMLKVRGVYNSALKADLSELMKADDGQYIPADDASVLAQGAGGLDKAIVHMPLDQIILVLRELHGQREQTKALIYEATGISDILRGATDPNETLGAQQIKAQWGSQRVQSQQREVARFARDLLRMKAELIATKFSAATLQQMTQIPSNEDEQQLWPQVEQLLRSDDMRSYRIDIETDSTIQADMARSQEQMNLFLAGTAQYAQAMLPLVQAGPQLMPPVIEIYAAFARKFKLGKQAEDALDKLSQMAQAMAQEAMQPQPDPEQQKAEAEAKAREDEMAMKREGHQMDMQAKVIDLQAKERSAQIDAASKEHSAAMAAQTAQMKAALPPQGGDRL